MNVHRRHKLGDPPPQKSGARSERGSDDAEAALALFMLFMQFPPGGSLSFSFYKYLVAAGHGDTVCSATTFVTTFVRVTTFCDHVRPMVVMFVQQSLASALHAVVCARSHRVADNGSPSSLRRLRRGHGGLSTNLTPDYCCTEGQPPEFCCSRRSNTTPPPDLDTNTSSTSVLSFDSAAVMRRIARLPALTPPLAGSPAPLTVIF